MDAILARCISIRWGIIRWIVHQQGFYAGLGFALAAVRDLLRAVGDSLISSLSDITESTPFRVENESLELHARIHREDSFGWGNWERKVVGAVYLRGRA
jgi:hypothetical protein